MGGEESDKGAANWPGDEECRTSGEQLEFFLCCGTMF